MLSSKQWNNKASDIKLVYLYSSIKMMHGPINIRFTKFSYFMCQACINTCRHYCRSSNMCVQTGHTKQGMGSTWPYKLYHHLLIIIWQRVYGWHSRQKKVFNFCVEVGSAWIMELNTTIPIHIHVYSTHNLWLSKRLCILEYKDLSFGSTQSLRNSAAILRSI